MRDEDKSPLFSAQATVSNRSYIGAGPVGDMIRRDLAAQIASAIVQSGHLQVTEGQYETTFRLEVMVMSPDALHREATRIAQQMMGYGRPYDIAGVPLT